MSYAICEQQRCRSACASAQSDQRLCCSLLRRNDSSSLCIRNFKILAAEQVSLSLAWSETPEDAFSHGVAHMYCILVVLKMDKSSTWFHIFLTSVHEHINKGGLSTIILQPLMILKIFWNV